VITFAEICTVVDEDLEVVVQRVVGLGVVQ
jgi:hypothetical protein